MLIVVRSVERRHLVVVVGSFDSSSGDEPDKPTDEDGDESLTPLPRSVALGPDADHQCGEDDEDEETSDRVDDSTTLSIVLPLFIEPVFKLLVRTGGFGSGA